MLLLLGLVVDVVYGDVLAFYVVQAKGFVIAMNFLYVELYWMNQLRILISRVLYFYCYCIVHAWVLVVQFWFSIFFGLCTSLHFWYLGCLNFNSLLFLVVHCFVLLLCSVYFAFPNFFGFTNFNAFLFAMGSVYETVVDGNATNLYFKCFHFCLLFDCFWFHI